MAQSLLERVQKEIQVRSQELRPVVDEYERLTEALAVLEGVGTGAPARRSVAAPAAPRSGGSARRRKPAATSTNSPPAKRAPRGANRAAVLRVLEERPGVGVTELASASGVSRPVLYNLVKTLEKTGEIRREELPGGVTGYRLRSNDDQAVAE